MEGCRCSRLFLCIIGRSSSISKNRHLSGRWLKVDVLSVHAISQQQVPVSFSTVAAAGQLPLRIGNVRVPCRAIDLTFFRDQHTKAQPVGNNILESSSSNAQEPDFVDPDVSLYHKPTRHSISINLRQKDAIVQGVKPSSAYLKEKVTYSDLNREVYESPEKLKTALREIHKREILSAQNNKKSPNVTSIDEMMINELKPHFETSKLPGIYAKLAKIRLSGLVVVTAMAGYAMAPGAFEASTFLLCSLGTAMTSASANTINQFLEVPYDAQMNRTRSRPIVKGQVSPLHAVSFAVFSGVVGTTVLYIGVNPLTAALGVFTLLLYTTVYTPMKRLSIANTWIGSVVGAVPPLMGWAASAGTLHSGAFLLGAVLYAWQFPHFCALSWNLQPDYSRAGYRMMSVIDPELCKRTSLRYSVVLTAVCLSAPYFDLTTWTFAADSLPLNAYMVYLAAKFYRDGDSNSSRKLFHFSLVHLPALLVLMLISKKHFGNKQLPAPET